MDGRLTRGFLVGALALLFPGLARADAVNSEWCSSTRALSMGNVGIASADDPSTAAFYNPAALARLKKPSFEAINAQADVGTGVFKDAHNIEDYMAVGSYSKSLPLLKGNPGTPIGARFNYSPNFSTQNFSFSILYVVDGASYYDDVSKAYYYHSRKLLIPSLGLSAAGLGGRFRVGASVRAVEFNETDIHSPTTGSTVTDLEYPRNGLGFSLDSGVMLTMPWAGLPTIGFVARNIGGVAFPGPPPLPVGGPTVLRHELVKMKYDVGFSLTPKLAQKNQLTIATDYRDALNVTGASVIRHVNLGVEYGASKFVFFRAGFSQGYWTAGFGLNVKQGSLDLGTFGEELDPTKYHGFGDRRYSMRLTRRF